MNPQSVRLMAVVASAAFGGCGGSSDLVMSELTEAEAQDLAGVVLVATFSSTGSVPQPVPTANGPQLVPFEITIDIEMEVECPLGGVVAVTAELGVSGDTEGPGGRVDYSMTQVHDACVVISENQRQFTIWGAPSLGVDLVVEIDGVGVVDWTGAIAGAVEWVTDGREGTCTLSLEFSGHAEGDGVGSAQLAGTVCGFSISQSVSIG